MAVLRTSLSADVRSAEQIRGRRLPVRRIMRNVGGDDLIDALAHSCLTGRPYLGLSGIENHGRGRDLVSAWRLPALCMFRDCHYPLVW
jgi:hypothetical protein